MQLRPTAPTGGFLHAKDNVILLGPPGTGKTHLSIALGIRACLTGQRVLFRTATEWVALLADAQRQGKLDEELARLERIPLLVCDEVGYIPFDPQAASLMFMLVSRRYERASMIVTSRNKGHVARARAQGAPRLAPRVLDRLRQVRDHHRGLEREGQPIGSPGVMADWSHNMIRVLGAEGIKSELVDGRWQPIPKERFTDEDIERETRRFSDQLGRDLGVGPMPR